MQVHAGIDEAGYGPIFGPLLVGRAVFAIDEPDAADGAAAGPGAARRAVPVVRPRARGRTSGAWSPEAPDLWKLLKSAVCRNLVKSKGRVAVNDSKKLHSATAGIRHLERAVLAFAGACGHQPASIDRLLDCFGETAHRDLRDLPWYAPDDARPWEPLPRTCTIGELAVARNMVSVAARKTGVSILDLGAAVCFEHRFNQMVSATRNKAATSFTFVARHLQHIWNVFGKHHPSVVVDHQSGRIRYLDLLAMTFPDAHIRVIEECETCSGYELTANDGSGRSMCVAFEVDADARHFTVALASMISKYSRELLMARFQNWFAHHAPAVRPTAGYAADGRRFWEEIQPIIHKLGIRSEHLLRAL